MERIRIVVKACRIPTVCIYKYAQEHPCEHAEFKHTHRSSVRLASDSFYASTYLIASGVKKFVNLLRRHYILSVPSCCFVIAQLILILHHRFQKRRLTHFIEAICQPGMMAEYAQAHDLSRELFFPRAGF